MGITPKRILRWLAAGVTLGAILVALHYAFDALTKYQTSLVVTSPVFLQPPYLHLGDQRPVARLQPGQYFFVHINNERSKSCTVEIRYRILSEQPHDGATHIIIWFSYDSTIGYTTAGRYEADTLLRVPLHLPPGNFSLDRFGSYTCGNVRFDQSHIGKLPFRLELPVIADTTRVEFPRDAAPSY